MENMKKRMALSAKLTRLFILMLACMLMGCSNEEGMETDEPAAATSSSAEGKSKQAVMVDMNDSNQDDYGKLYYAPVEEKHVAGEGMERFVDNEMLIVVRDGVSREQVQKLADAYQCEIVGEIEVTGDYQLRIANALSKEELETLLSRVRQEDVVANASVNYVTLTSETEVTKERGGFYYGKEWEGDLQDFNNADGKSWGFEAINTIGAWDELARAGERVKPVRVGLIDSGFDFDHVDLGFVAVFYDHGENGGLWSKKNDHGTKVAGVMAANCDDDTGICGVYPYGNKNLYGIVNTDEQGASLYNDSVMAEKISVAELVVRNVKVINSSRGANYYSQAKDFKDWYDDESRFRFLEPMADLVGDFLQRLLDKGYDFVIVSGAGNNSDGLPAKFDCKYTSIFNRISREKFPAVYDRIIVAGAVTKRMNISPYSDGGDRVDVYGPGGIYEVQLFTTAPDNGYGEGYGTSIASPFVSGVAAMVWSANNSLTGAEVKRCVTQPWNPRCTACHLVDAEQAVKLALERNDDGTRTEETYGSILSYVVERYLETRVGNAAVTLKNSETGESYTTTTDSQGHFEILLPEGKYTLSVKADGFEDYEWPDGHDYQNPIEVRSNEVTYLDDWIKLTRVGRDEVQLTVFAKDAETFLPIQDAKITLQIHFPDRAMTIVDSQVSGKDGAAIFPISMDVKNQMVDCDLYFSIDGYQDFVVYDYVLENDPIDMLLMVDAFFKKKIELTNEYYEKVLGGCNVGDYVMFGSYEQDHRDENGKEPMEWLVLDKKDDKILLISRYLMESRKYHYSSANDLTWETSTMREWLNKTFFEAAFGEEELDWILDTKITMDRNPEFDTPVGNDTTDKVFLLSVEEANTYFSEAGKRKCYDEQDELFQAAKGACPWWLRTPGFEAGYVAFVSTEGNVVTYGTEIYSDLFVRPAMWVKISK